MFVYIIAGVVYTCDMIKLSPLIVPQSDLKGIYSNLL